MNREDLTGQRFGKLLVTGIELSKRQQTLQVCLCDCGTISKMLTSRLTKKRVESCGCVRLAQRAVERRIRNARSRLGYERKKAESALQKCEVLEDRLKLLGTK